MQQAVRCVNEINCMTAENGISYCRKEMMSSGLSLDLDGISRVEQFYPHLQETSEFM